MSGRTLVWLALFGGAGAALYWWWKKSQEPKILYAPEGAPPEMPALTILNPVSRMSIAQRARAAGF